MLFLDRNNLELSTFPIGNFNHNIVDDKTASSLLDNAINNNNLCALHNDNEDGDIDELKEFIEIMKNKFNLHIGIKNFFIEDIDENNEVEYLPNYNLFHTITENDSLLVVEYNFILKNNDINNFDTFNIDPNFKFHLFTPLKNNT